MPCRGNRRLDFEKESQNKQSKDRRRNNLKPRAKEPESHEWVWLRDGKAWRGFCVHRHRHDFLRIIVCKPFWYPQLWSVLSFDNEFDLQNNKNN